MDYIGGNNVDLDVDQAKKLLLPLSLHCLLHLTLPIVALMDMKLLEDEIVVLGIEGDEMEVGIEIAQVGV